MDGFSHVIVTTADLDRALGLWSDTMGLNVQASRQGLDPGTAAVLGVGADAITRQAVVGMPGAGLGRLHLVELARPGEPVRAGAATTDLCPKNLDLRCVDLPDRVEELRAAGYRLRSDWHRLPVDWAEIREVQLLAPDEVNVSLIEVVGEDLPFTPAGYFGLTLAVATSRDNRAERGFFTRVFGLEELSHNLLSGPEVEEMVGVPSGTELDIFILGGPGEELGRVELVSYRGAPGVDRYRQAEAPATGSLRICFTVESGVMDAYALPDLHHGDVDTPAVSGRAVTLRTPAGWGVVVFDAG